MLVSSVVSTTPTILTPFILDCSSFGCSTGGAGTTELSGGAVELEFERIGLPSISTGSDEGACAGIIGFPSMSVWNPLKSWPLVGVPGVGPHVGVTPKKL